MSVLTSDSRTDDFGSNDFHTDEIRQAKIDLAAAFRWAARLGWQSGVCNHFSVTVPGRPDLFIVNPEGFFWDELTASDLVVCDYDGNVLDSEHKVEATAFYLHSRIHRSNPKHQAVLHTHMPYATALCMLRDGRVEPASQTAFMFHGKIAYDEDYGGLALSNEEGDRVAAALGDNQVIMMRNHGALIVGTTLAEAFNRLYYFEEACKHQMIAMSANRPLHMVPSRIAETVVQAVVDDRYFHDKFLAAIKRRLDREDPSYAD